MASPYSKPYRERDFGTVDCAMCGEPFARRHAEQRYCSQVCVGRLGVGRDHRRGVLPTPWQERFWRYVAPADPAICWEWTGSRDQHGYGRLNSGGKNGRILKAHRASYEIEHGPIPEGMAICHHCDNPPCVNPAHLFMGTMRDNTQDMLRKGRAAAHQEGFDTGRTKVGDDVVRAIRERAAAGERYCDIASDYGVGSQWVSEVARGNRRARAGGPIVPKMSGMERRLRRRDL